METSLIVGNIFSLLSAICVAISVVKKNKTDLICWQVVDLGLGLVAHIVLAAYTAVTLCIIGLYRNIMAYQNKLTLKKTILITILCAVIGLYVNNRGFYGVMVILATTSYTVFMYAARNDQQMRYALVLNLILWIIHNVYIQAYPTAVMQVILMVWTIIQIIRYYIHPQLRMHPLQKTKRYHVVH